MSSSERRNEAIQLVSEQRAVLAQDLTGILVVPEATAHANLHFLEQKGAVTCFHSGAAKIMSDNSETEIQEARFRE